MLYRIICILTLVVITLFAVTFTVVAGANANLFVSAENSIFSNFFAGPMVIEVVVIGGIFVYYETLQPDIQVSNFAASPFFLEGLIPKQYLIVFSEIGGAL